MGTAFIDYELEIELEYSYNNKLCQRLSKQFLDCKYDEALYNLFRCKLHSNIVQVAKNSTSQLC